jgi:hypothetical protein
MIEDRCFKLGFAVILRPDAAALELVALVETVHRLGLSAVFIIHGPIMLTFKALSSDANLMYTG